VEALEALPDEDLEARQLDMGFLPAPIDVAFFASMRLSEMALHAWDVDVAFDPATTVDEHTLPYALGVLTSFAGYFAKPAGKSGTADVTLTHPSRSFTLRLTGDGVQLEEGPAADADTSVTMPAEAFARLIGGRLDTGHTPPSVQVDGTLSLDDLRRNFPGF
jgi:MDMPI C-terminal domain